MHVDEFNFLPESGAPLFLPSVQVLKKLHYSFAEIKIERAEIISHRPWNS